VIIDHFVITSHQRGEVVMTQIFTSLIVLACPIGMASMMVLPVLGRRLTRRSPDPRTATRS
jgi:hypothetical protein